MKAKTARRALFMSVLSLLLCVSMLVGATFAWFTDSVTSANNIIKSGNLDVEMYWADGVEAVPADDSTDWVDASTGAIFDYDLWEPGFTQVRHIKIANKGNLALKYKVNIIPNGEVSTLADVIDVYYVDPAVQVANRTDLNDANKLGTLTQVLEKLGETGSGELIAGASDTITIAFKMQETAGNEYMNKAIGTDFSVQLLATQLTYESDSFDANYDQAARYPVVSLPGTLPEAGNTEPVADMLLKTMDGVSTQIPAGLVENIGDEYTNAQELRLTHTEPVFDAAAKTVSFGNIDIVDENGNVIELEAMNNTIPITVVVPVGDTFEVGETVIVYHDGEPVASAQVDAAKNVTYTITHFCEVVVSAGDGTVDTAMELAVALAQGGDITLANDIAVDKALEIPVGVEVDLNLNGNTINTAYAEGSTTNHVYAFTNNGKLLLKNGTVNARGIFNYGDMIIENATINAIDGNGGYAIRNYPGSTLTMNSGTIATTLEDDNLSDKGGYDATTLRVDAGASAVINGGTIKNICDFTSAIENYGTVVVNDAEITAIHTAVYNGGTMTFNGGSVSCGMNGTTRHTIYNVSGKTAINGGTFINTATDQNATGASVINGAVTVNAGTFNGRIESYSGTPVIKGGTFSVDPSAYLASGYVATESNGTYTVEKQSIVYDSTTMGDLYTFLPTLKSGDILILPAKTYVTTGTFRIPAGVTIKGEKGAEVIIQQQNAGQDNIFDCEGDVVIENITFETNRKGYAINGVDHESSFDITVINCKFKGLAADKNWGIYKNSHGNLTIKNCTFDTYNNAVCGVKNLGGSTTVITGCTFTNIAGEAIGYVNADVPADFETTAIANNTGLTADNVIGY